VTVVALHPRRSIVEVVLGVHRSGRRRHGVMAAAGGVVMCALLGLSGLLLEPRREVPPEVAAARAPVEISLDEAVAPIAPAPSRAVPEPVRVPTPRRPARAAVPSHVAPRAASPPPAQPATVVARQPPPSAPIDMTGETLVAGSAREYAGGVTAAGGTSTDRGHTRGTSLGATSAGAGAGDRSASAGAGQSAPVGLASQSWSCPWPSEAEPLPIDEETVVIRIVVRSDGRAESVAVVSDPGHGFGQAAAACAMRTAFTSARDAGGHPVHATSAPIRVRFTRR
jgi:periplasmic protein TonB